MISNKNFETLMIVMKELQKGINEQDCVKSRKDATITMGIVIKEYKNRVLENK